MEVVNLTFEFHRYVSENLKPILIRLEDDISLENDVEDHAEMLKTLFVNHKVSKLVLCAGS